MPTSSSPPWPSKTPQPAPSLKRKRSRRHWRPDSSSPSSKFSPRQLALPSQVDDAAERCQWTSGNDITTCFPTTETTVAQGEWSAVVWNSRLPVFTQTDLVDLYLFRADSLRQVLHYPNVSNPVGRAGLQTALVNDTWWGDDADKWNGSNLTYPFYWMVVRSDRGITPSDIPQARFNAVQTTYADSVIASSSASAASASALSAASATASATSTPRPTKNGDGNLIPPSGASGFPNWAIAVIVVLGFLALVAMCILAFFLIRRTRRRGAYSPNRGSMSSGTPMMQNIPQAPHSPIAAITPMNQPASSSDHHYPPPASLAHDGASTISRAGSAGESAPFSGADAAILADAFRHALRKPDFANQPVEEGESPDEQELRRMKEIMLNRELAEEGRDIRSVSSSRGVRVETMSDSGDTAHDHR